MKSELHQRSGGPGGLKLGSGGSGINGEGSWLLGSNGGGWRRLELL